ncbi:PREDICTED: coiled-coil domain-containing protein 124 [Diuraphis noxia]|uniref:coiled-coil domain-containing protein 124 n=1 Tax=Diuraphis noxia TaxID=143948 RepID=UPI00076374BD|nr:PREDICTED: coiled-coil domain-containing protein 124 [Diuraphis noxia]
MPKKFVGMNSKASEAKARRDAIKQEADALKKKAIEDEFWKDDDKNIAKKQKRKEEKEKKKIEHLEKKREAQILLETELSEIKTTQINQKITRHQLMKELDTSSNLKSKSTLNENEECSIEENLNRLTMHDEEARTVDEALDMLNFSKSFANVGSKLMGQCELVRCFGLLGLEIIMAEAFELLKQLQQGKSVLRKETNGQRGGQE